MLLEEKRQLLIMFAKYASYTIEFGLSGLLVRAHSFCDLSEQAHLKEAVKGCVKSQASI